MSGQNRLVLSGPLKVLITSLDSTHDPQLICLCLEIVANLCISGENNNHKVLISADIEDSLMQLILPSDQWFYTNTTTKYAKYVKHHAMRVLVYIGRERRLRNKVNLFDLIGKYRNAMGIEGLNFKNLDEQDSGLLLQSKKV